MSCPVIVDQYENVVGETPRFETREQSHFVEGQDDVRSVTGIRDPATLGKANAVGRSPLPIRMRRRPDLGGDDLPGPKPVARLGAELGEGNGWLFGPPRQRR